MSTTSTNSSATLIFEAGKTYIIDETFTLTETLKLPENVTLIFQGGKFISDNEIEIIGNHTALIAPIAPIFGINVKATGSWDIDCAYPQWFEATTFQFNDRTTPDIADSIQKAIDMKGTGKVFLLPGNYYITHPLYIPLGITLEGISGQPHEGEYAATQIFPASYNGSYKKGLYPHDYLIYVNSNSDGSSKFNYPDP